MSGRRFFPLRNPSHIPQRATTPHPQDDTSGHQIIDGTSQPDTILNKFDGLTAEGGLPPAVLAPSGAAYLELQALLEEQNDPNGIFQSTSSSWEDVIKAMDDARTKYEAKGANSKLRKLSRNEICITTLGYLAKMIPVENGMQILCGGLTMVFKLAQKHIQLQERILYTFNEIPFILEDAELALQDFRDDQELQDRVKSLCEKLLKEVIPKLVKVLLRNHDGKIHQRLWKQYPENEAVVVDRCLNDISDSTKAVNRRLDAIRNRLSVKTYQKVTTYGQTIDEAVTKLHELQSSVSELAAMTKQANANASQYLQSFGSVELFELKKAVHEKCSLMQGNITVPNSPLGAATQDIREAGSWQSDLLWETTTATSSRQLPTDTFRMNTSTSFDSAYQYRENYMMTTGDMALADALHDELIELLSAPRYSHFSDLERVLRQGTNIEENFLQRGKWLLNMGRFNNWLYSEGADMLLVEGYCEENFGKVSSLSVSCAILVTRLIEGGSMVLYHFCGEHTSRTDPMFGPASILKSFVLQLAAYGCPIDAVFGHLLDESLLQGLQEHTLYAFAALFRKLLECIPRDHEVYIIIDNISEFESKLYGWDEDTRTVVELIQLSAANDPGLRLKTLMTCSITSLVVREMLAPQDKIALRGDNHFA